MADASQLPGAIDVSDEDQMAADIYRHAAKHFTKEPAVALDYMLRLFALYHRNIEFDIELDDLED